MRIRSTLVGAVLLILASSSYAQIDPSQFFRAKTSDTLTAAFRPVVTYSMKDVGVVQHYKQLQSSYQSVPFASSLPSMVFGK